VNLTAIADNNHNVIGRIKYDTNNRLVAQFNQGISVEPHYQLANFNDSDSYTKQAIVISFVMDSKIDETPITISPVQSQDSQNSLASSPTRKK